MALVTFVAMLAVAEYFYFTVQVARARGRTGLLAPAVTGVEEFERYFRVQQNTVEQLVVFLPSLFAAGWFVGEVFAAAAGFAFIIGRGIYYVAYTRDPTSRRAGVMVSFGANAVLLLAGLLGAFAGLVG